jgi:hypothetical protein
MIVALLVSVSACQKGTEKDNSNANVVQSKAAAFEVLSEAEAFDLVRKTEKNPTAPDLRVIRSQKAQWSLAEVLGAEALLLTHPDLLSRLVSKDKDGRLVLNPAYKAEIYLDYNFASGGATDPTDLTYRNLDLMPGQLSLLNESSAKITGLALPSRGFRTEAISHQLTIVVYKIGLQPADLLVIVPLK